MSHAARVWGTAAALAAGLYLGHDQIRGSLSPYVFAEPAARPAQGPEPRPAAEQVNLSMDPAPKPARRSAQAPAGIGRHAADPRPADPIIAAAERVYQRAKALPYVWGGEALDAEAMRAHPSYSPRQPAGSWRAGLATVPGVDCSGLVHCIRVEAGKEAPADRKSAEGYRRTLAEVLPSGSYSVEQLSAAVRPGDHLFVMGNKKATHIALVIGNGRILESAGTEQPDYAAVPPLEWESWRAQAEPRHKTDADRGGPQINALSKYADRRIAVGRD